MGFCVLDWDGKFEDLTTLLNLKLMMWSGWAEYLIWWFEKKINEMENICWWNIKNSVFCIQFLIRNKF